MLSISHGNKYQLIYNVKQPDGNIKDLTGTLELKYQISKRVNKPAIFQFTLADPEVSITDAVNGQITITLTSTIINQIPAGSYYHEIWQTNALGDPTTLLAERLDILDKLIEQ